MQTLLDACARFGGPGLPCINIAGAISSTLGVWSLEFDAWSLTFGVCRLEFGVRRLARPELNGRGRCAHAAAEMYIA